MINIKDQMLVDLQSSMPWDDWIEDLKEIIDNSSYHSDEISESDTENVHFERKIQIMCSMIGTFCDMLMKWENTFRISKLKERGGTMINCTVHRKPFQATSQCSELDHFTVFFLNRFNNIILFKNYNYNMQYYKFINFKS
jgi:hypothetical protein